MTGLAIFNGWAGKVSLSGDIRAEALAFTPRWEPWEGFTSRKDIVVKGSLTLVIKG